MPDLKQVTVLNVDDNEKNRYVITRVLERAGYVVKEATTGAQALAMAADRPSLILLDVNLPDISGFEVCRILKADPVLQSIPVVHLTASYATSASKAQGLEGGADGYLMRPVEPAELTATVHSVLRMREAEMVATAMSEEWQATFDAIADGAVLLDREGNVIRTNRAMDALLNSSTEELRGKGLRGPLESLIGSPVTDICAVRDMSDRREWEVESGSRWFRITADPVTAKSGVLTGAVYIVADITTRKHAEQVLEANRSEIFALNRRLREGIRETHHRVKNNLQIIAAIVDLQVLDELESVPVSELRRLASHVRALATVHDMLTARAGGDHETPSEEVSAEAVLAQLLSFLQTTTPTHDISYDLEDASLTVRQATSLALVTNEIVSNAIKHGDKTVGISFSTCDRSATLVVQDDGPGFPEDFDVEKSANTGLELVSNLCRWDLAGVLEFGNDPGGGGRVRLHIPLS